MCKQEKSARFFYKDRFKLNGLSSRCRECHRIYSFNRVRQDRDTIHQYRFRRYKRGAKDRGISFELSFEDFKKLWGMPCYYCKEDIEGIGVDRVDRRIGYKKNNILPCCSDCNSLKGKIEALRVKNKEFNLKRIKKSIKNIFAVMEKLSTIT